MTTSGMPSRNFSPPGKGAWEFDATHFPAAVPRLQTELYETVFAEGFREGSALYGILLDFLQYRAVDGFLYVQGRPFGAPAGAPTPPRFVFWLLTRLHPGLRARLRDAATL